METNCRSLPASADKLIVLVGISGTFSCNQAGGDLRFFIKFHWLKGAKFKSVNEKLHRTRQTEKESVGHPASLCRRRGQHIGPRANGRSSQDLGSI